MFHFFPSGFFYIHKIAAAAVIASEKSHANSALSSKIQCCRFNFVSFGMCIFFDHFNFSFGACMRYCCLPFCRVYVSQLDFHHVLSDALALINIHFIHRIHLVDCIWLFNAYRMMIMMMIHFNSDCTAFDKLSLVRQFHIL